MATGGALVNVTTVESVACVARVAGTSETSLRVRACSKAIRAVIYTSGTFIDIFTIGAVPTEAPVADAGPGSYRVLASGIRVAVMCTGRAFVNVVTIFTISCEPSVTSAKVISDDVYVWIGAKSEDSTAVCWTFIVTLSKKESSRKYAKSKRQATVRRKPHEQHDEKCWERLISSRSNISS